MIIIWAFLICAAAGLVLGFGQMLLPRWLGKKRTERIVGLKDKFLWPFIGLLLLLAIVFWFGKAYLGTKVPGSFFERGSYSAKVYVLVFPENDASKNYYVPADIQREDDGTYTVNEIHWSNGGSASFDQCTDVTLSTKTDCQDSDAQSYEIQLTGNTVSN